MRRSTLLLSTSFLAIGFGLVAHAATPTAISDYHVSSIIPADDALKPYCAMANRFDNGLIVTHSRNNFGLGSLSFDFPDVEFDQGKNYQITVKAGSITRRYAAVASKDSLLIAKTGRDDVLFNMLDDGTPLSIELENGTVIYNVASDKKAFAEFEECITGLEIETPTITSASQTPENLAPLVEEKPLEKITPPTITPPPVIKTITEPVLATDQIVELAEKPVTLPITRPIEEAATPKIIQEPVELGSLTDAPKFIPSQEEIVPLSQPVNPAQIGLEKTTRRHSIASSDLLFDNPDAARLAVPSTITNKALVEPKTNTMQPDFIINEPAPLLKEVAKAPPALPPIIEEPVEVLEPVIKTPEPVIIEAPEVIEAPQPHFTRENVLPTNALVDAPAPKTLTSSPVTQINVPEAVAPVAVSPILTPPPALAMPMVKEEVKKPIIEKTPDVEIVEPTPVIPAITQPTPQPRFVASAPKTFIPPAAPSVQSWTIKNIDKTSDLPSYCLISNRFENGMGLYATRSPDGSSTLGLDFGFDILEPNRQYGVTVEVDHLFNEAFTAQASDDAMMVVQMGKKDAFFNALRRGQALHISMPGAASTFDLDKIGTAYTSFTQCLASQNGTMIAETTMPVVKAPVAVAVTAPIKKTQTETTLPLFDQSPVQVVTNMPSTPVLIAPTPSEVETVEFSNFSRQFTPQNNFVTDNLSVSSILTASRIGHSGVRIDDQDPDIMHWVTGDQNIQGVLVETPWSTETSLLDRLMEDIDMMEQTCIGEFTSQIGIPENYGQDVIANAETKCTINGKAVSAAHIYQGTGNTIKVWTQSGPSTLSQEILGSRNKIAGILRQRATANAVN